MHKSSNGIAAILAELRELRELCLTTEKEFGESIAQACVQSRESARNLLDYVALRMHDLRDLQSRLAALGLSSLGRTEACVRASLDALVRVVESLSGEHPFNPSGIAIPPTFQVGAATLAEHAADLLGPAPKGRAVRIMVTMPGEAANSYALIEGLVRAGMDVMRVNCAHDSEREWEAMIAFMRRANQELGKYCRVEMDLAGPKLRTGPINKGNCVARWKIGRDARGAVIVAARIALTCRQPSMESLPGFDVQIPAPEALLLTCRVGDTVRIRDIRGKKRMLMVTHQGDHWCVCTCERGAYVSSRAEISLIRDGEVIETGHVGDLPFVEEPLRLKPRDLLVVTKEENHAPARHREIPHISCTLPKVFSRAKAGQPIFFDDGRIEGCILEAYPDHILVEISHTGAGEARLGSAKGINLPETDLGISAMTAKDRRDLDFVAKHADIVGLSFVNRPEDVVELLQELRARDRAELGVILKIETRAGFDRLPHIMLAALRHHPVGVMVARGDLAVEAGFERLAEIQEEILWLSEAAHMPVVWATQVLETLAKTGVPSRAEVTDAAMGVRAECVMLNKGEHVLEAVIFLDHVLHRMQAHHLKKRSMLRRLAVAQMGHAAGGVSPETAVVPGATAKFAPDGACGGSN